MEQKVQQEILRVKELMSEQILSSSDTLFGGPKVSIPRSGGHNGQKGWQSGNAWDIPTQIGTPVYAIADGKLVTFKNYGPIPVHTQGKTLFGAGFTVDSDNGLPDVYYTHLKDTTVKEGDHVKCGQLLGYVMDFPNSSYDHVHIGIEDGHDIKEFLTNDGKIKCNGVTITPGSPLSSFGSTSGSQEKEESLLDKILNSEFGGKKIKDLIDVAEDKFVGFMTALSDMMKRIR